MRLGEIARVRSKNAGPFHVTIDVFCETAETFERVRRALPAEAVAALLGQSAGAVTRYELPELHVLKFSLPRPQVQGARNDRDMHGAQLALLLDRIEL